MDGPVLRPFLFGDDPYAAGLHRGIDIGIVVFSTLAVVCLILAVIRLAWVKHKDRSANRDEERALRRWQNHRRVEPTVDTTDEIQR